MATSAYVSTPETTNANRASRILLGPCTDQLRDVLRKRIPPANFHHVITNNRSKLPRLTQCQMDLILPRAGKYIGDYSDFDISLLYLILRNVCNIPSHSNGWGNIPDKTDHSLSASIDRIRNSRNRVVHNSSTILAQKDFNDLLGEIKMAVIPLDLYLNKHNAYEKGVDFLLTETMDPEQEWFIEKLRKQVAEDKITKELVTNLEGLVKDNQEHTERILTKQEESQRIYATLTEDVRAHSVDIVSLQTQQQESQREQLALADSLQAQSIKISTLTRNVEQIKLRKGNNDEADFSTLKQRLLEINGNETRQIPLSFVQKGGDKLPIEQLFSSVVIKEDSKEIGTRKSQTQYLKQQKQKEVKTPEDLLTKNGNQVPRIFMHGDAAYGKTTYCMWLLSHWCNSQQPGMRGRPLNEWEKALGQFDFVFHISLRHVNPTRASVIDMICHDILSTDISLVKAGKHVLSSNEYRCFIIMDGLDEWKPDQTVVNQLKYKGMPNIDSMSNCIIFTTMRTWMFSEVEEMVRANDKVVEIQGLAEKSIEAVIENVLIHYYKMKPATAEYKATHRYMISRLKDKTVKSFIKIPLLAVVCVQIWYEREQVGDNMTSFYIALVNTLIQRAHLKHETQKFDFEGLNLDVPTLLSSKKDIKKYFNVLIKLGKLAYKSLISKEMKLVFLKNDLEAEIGEKELKFALDVGLISQKEVHSALESKVSVHFFHKSVQEFLAAIYIVTQKDTEIALCEHMCNVKVIMELSNVIMFIFGMCPSLCSLITRHVVSVTDGDIEICKYRESPRPNSTVIELYKLKLKWYQESRSGRRENPVTFNIADIYLSKSSDKGTIGMTRVLLSDNHVRIKTLYLLDVPTDRERGITNKELNDFFSKTEITRSLDMVCIIGLDTDRCVHPISIPTLRRLYLRSVFIQNSDAINGPVIKQMDKLQELSLGVMTLDNRDLGLKPYMSHLRRVTLDKVNMTASGWGRVLLSLIDIHHEFHISLQDTNIDNNSMSEIRSSSHFSVTLEGVDRLGIYRLEFARIWPITSETQ